MVAVAQVRCTLYLVLAPPKNILKSQTSIDAFCASLCAVINWECVFVPLVRFSITTSFIPGCRFWFDLVEGHRVVILAWDGANGADAKPLVFCFFFEHCRKNDRDLEFSKKLPHFGCATSTEYPRLLHPQQSQWRCFFTVTLTLIMPIKTRSGNRIDKLMTIPSGNGANNSMFNDTFCPMLHFSITLGWALSCCQASTM